MTLSMMETFRWYGPQDPVTLQHIKQCGCEGVMTSLHQIPYGAVWSEEEIRKRKNQVEEAGLKWAAVESVPVHEEIKTRIGVYERWIRNYKTTLENLGAQSIDTVIYNFMPVLDWVRTDMAHELEDGTQCLYYDPIRFAAFELFFLKRREAEKDYSTQQIEEARRFYDSMDPGEREAFEQSIIDVFPGCKLGLSIGDVRHMLEKYQDITPDRLKEHLRLFLEEVIPVAEKAGVKMAIHPDDPPYSILGLPRIVSCEEDLNDILSMHKSPSNGLCFCTGSLSPRPDNDLPGMISRLGDRIHVLHLRSTQRMEDGSFYEANHLEGSVDMYGVVRAALSVMKGRRDKGHKDWRLAFRPDHGHLMLDDLNKPKPENPGYSCIGRMRGLAELRGLQMGIARSCF